tara:strand:+ start:23 stop:769 length:747 start_codon:yes stop_codon:yes gene_type:complete
MRIAFSGTGNSGKSETIRSFLYTWNQYNTPEKTYRDILEEDNLEHSTKTSIDTQVKILDSLIKQVESYKVDDKVVHDRCPLDNIAYTIWAHEKNKEDFTKEFVSEQISKMRESMRHLDIIFLCRFDPNLVTSYHGPDMLVGDNTQKLNSEFITEVDNIFNSILSQYTQNPEADILFPKGDSPVLIDLPNKAQERIDIIHQYIGNDGTLIEDEPSILSDIDKLEGLMLQQENALEAENKEKELFKRFGI